MIILILFFLAVPVTASCPKNSEVYEGVCVAMPAPEEQTLAPIVQGSTETAPTDKMPSYEREGIHADMPPSLTAYDIAADEAKKAADAQGKKAAIIP